MVGRHYYCFGKNISEKLRGKSLDAYNWDVIRCDDHQSPFSIEKTVEEYEENCRKQEEYKKVALIINKIIEEHGLSDYRVVSCGAGKGILEWHIKHENSEQRLLITDYAEQAIAKLKAVFCLAAVDFSAFNFIEGDYSAYSEDSIVLFYRVTSECSKKQWIRVFERMYAAGVKYVIYVPEEIFTVSDILKTELEHVKNMIKRKPVIKAGWKYTKEEFNQFWETKNSLYSIVKEITIDKSSVFFLKRNEI